METVVRLAQLPLDHLVCSEDVRAYKPRPDVFLRAMEEIGVAPQETLVVGDSNMFDVEPASQLGILTAWLNRQNRPVPENCKADAVLTSLQQLRRMMQ